MKKKIFSIVGIAAFAVVVAFNVNIGLRGEFLSDLVLANVEALAQGEHDWENGEYWDPWGLVNSNCCGDGCFPVYLSHGSGWIGCGNSSFKSDFCCYGK